MRAGPPGQGVTPLAAATKPRPVPMSGRAQLKGPGGRGAPTGWSAAVRGRFAGVGTGVGWALQTRPPTPAGVERQREALARTGVVRSIVPAWMLISGGSVLRRVKRRRS